MAVIFSPLAENDLGEIVEYIARDNPTAARQVVGELHAAIDSLAERPRMGHRRTDLVPERDLRF